jgi:hypothetical protein
MGGQSALDRMLERGLDVAATYNLLYNGSLLVETGMGVAVCFDGIVRAGEGTPFAFVPLQDMPATPSWLAWKRHVPLSRASDLVLREMRAI